MAPTATSPKRPLLEVAPNDKPLFHGLIPAIITPFTAAGEVDHQAVPILVERLIASEVSGLFACGSTGEGMHMTVEQRKEMLTCVITACAGRIPVMAMIGACPLADAIELAKHAEMSGATAISAVCPGTYAWTGEAALDLAGCAAFWKELAASTPMPFYAYYMNMVAQPAAFLEAVADIPTFSGVKFTARDLYTFQQIGDLAPKVLGRRLNMLSGPDECQLAAMAMGADGAIGSTYNLCPKLYMRMRTAFEAGLNEDALALQTQANAMIRALLDHTRVEVQMTNIICGIKAILRDQGVAAAGLPLSRSVNGYTPECEATLLASIRTLGFELE